MSAGRAAAASSGSQCAHSTVSRRRIAALVIDLDCARQLLEAYCEKCT
jgi:hypothetical protein